MENFKNRHTVDIVMSEEKLKELATQPAFKQFKIFQENLVVVERAKIELTLNWPIYAGFTILDLSKILRYDFHYNYIKQKYPELTLLFTKTDSLKFQIQMVHVFEDFSVDEQMLDFSEYKKESPFYNDENKK